MDVRMLLWSSSYEVASSRAQNARRAVKSLAGRLLADGASGFEIIEPGYRPRVPHSEILSRCP